MAAVIDGVIEAIAAERDRLERRLEREESFRALRQLEAREAAGEWFDAVEGGLMLEGLERELTRITEFARWRRLGRALEKAAAGDPVDMAALLEERSPPVNGARVVSSLTARGSGAAMPPADLARLARAAGFGAGGKEESPAGGPPPPMGMVRGQAPPPPAAGAAREPLAVPAHSELTRIGGIDAKMAARLDAIGIGRLEQVAAWSDADVGRLAFALQLGGRIEHEHWVAQARALLAEAGEVPRLSVARRPLAAPALPRISPPPFVPPVEAPAAAPMAETAPVSAVLVPPAVLVPIVTLPKAIAVPVPTPAPAPIVLSDLRADVPEPAPADVIGEPGTGPVENAAASDFDDAPADKAPVIAGRATVELRPALGHVPATGLGTAAPEPVDDGNPLGIEEANVTIIARGEAADLLPPFVPTRDDVAGRRLAGERTFDSESYAAYRGSIEEASIEIVHKDRRARGARPGAEADDGDEHKVRKYLKTLTGE